MRVLSKKQKKLDKNNDGKLSGEDFKMMAYGGKMPEYGGGGRMYNNGGGIPAAYGYGMFAGAEAGAPSSIDMYNSLSPALQDFARSRAGRERYYGSGKGSFYEDVMRRNNQFAGLMDRDGNVLPQMQGEEMRQILGNRGDLGYEEAKMSMMLNRMLQRAMAGDTVAENFLNRVNSAYDARLAGEQSEAARQARLSKGSGKPGPFER